MHGSDFERLVQHVERAQEQARVALKPEVRRVVIDDGIWRLARADVDERLTSQNAEPPQPQYAPGDGHEYDFVGLISGVELYVTRPREETSSE